MIGISPSVNTFHNNQKAMTCLWGHGLKPKSGLKHNSQTIDYFRYSFCNIFCAKLQTALQTL